MSAKKGNQAPSSPDNPSRETETERGFIARTFYVRGGKDMSQVVNLHRLPVGEVNCSAPGVWTKLYRFLDHPAPFLILI